MSCEGTFFFIQDGKLWYEDKALNGSGWRATCTLNVVITWSRILIQRCWPKALLGFDLCQFPQALPELMNKQAAILRLVSKDERRELKRRCVISFQDIVFFHCPSCFDWGLRGLDGSTFCSWKDVAGRNEKQWARNWSESRPKFRSVKWMNGCLSLCFAAALFLLHVLLSRLVWDEFYPATISFLTPAFLPRGSSLTGKPVIGEPGAGSPIKEEKDKGWPNSAQEEIALFNCWLQCCDGCRWCLFGFGRVMEERPTICRYLVFFALYCFFEMECRLIKGIAVRVPREIDLLHWPLFCWLSSICFVLSYIFGFLALNGVVVVYFLWFGNKKNKKKSLF